MFNTRRAVELKIVKFTQNIISIDFISVANTQVSVYTSLSKNVQKHV